MIEVEFPDGTVCEVDSVSREIRSREIGGPHPSRFVQEPAFDPEWRFTSAIGGRWFAKPRR
jgi:hypothetical protein